MDCFSVPWSPGNQFKTPAESLSSGSPHSFFCPVTSAFLLSGSYIFCAFARLLFLLQKIRFFFCFPSANRDFDVFPVSGLFYGTCGMNQKRNPHFVLCLCLKGWCSNPLLPVNILSDHSLREAVPLQGLLKNTGVGSSLQSPQTVCFKTVCLQMLLSRFVFRLIFIFGSRSFSALSTRKPAY